MKQRMINRIRKHWALILSTSALALMGFLGISTAYAAESLLANASPTMVGTLKESLRPQGVPTHFVVTPNGYFSPQCVQVVHARERLRTDGSIQQADGTLRTPAACTQAHYALNGSRVETNGTTTAAAQRANPTINGWVESTNYASNINIGRITASWTVPSAPNNQSGQVVYFFPGLEQLPTVVSILQPVLGWNGYGDNAWTMASWNCCVNGTTYHSDPISVASGDGIIGDTYSTCGAGVANCGTWAIVSEDLHTGQNTTLYTNPQGSPTWVFGSVLEAYGVNTCDQFPSNGLINFYNIAVYDTNGNQIGSPPWGQANAGGSTNPQCNYGIYSVWNGSTLYF